jgi:hypothetical protein
MPSQDIRVVIWNYFISSYTDTALEFTFSTHAVDNDTFLQAALTLDLNNKY